MFSLPPFSFSYKYSFFNPYKFKQVKFYRINYRTETEVKKGINNFMNFYNTKRPHSLLRYRTADVYEAKYFSKHTDSKQTETGQ